MGGSAWVIMAVVVAATTASLSWHTEEQVFKFLNESTDRIDLSMACRQALERVEPYLKDEATLEARRILFSQSYSTGPASLFLSRDHDRWIYRGHACIQSPGETLFSRSEYPMHYCYGYNDEDPSIDAYSICIPSQCEEEHVEILEMWRATQDDSLTSPRIDFTACTKSRHEKQWYELAVPVLDFGANLMAVLVVVLATVFHYKRGEHAKSFPAQLLLAFSAKKNLKKLWELPKDPQATLTCMYGQRFLAMLWVLVGHSFIVVQAYIDNVDDFKNDLVDNIENSFITNCTLSVDVFFVLGGTVLSYSWFRKWSKSNSEVEPSWNSWGYWLRFYRHRVIRLWPAYLYTLTTITLRISITHFHPLWPPTDPAVQCPVHFWENIFFLNSVFHNRCIPWTWYIGTEFIYYLLSPIFLLAIRKSARLGVGVCGAVIALSAALNAVSIVQNNFPPTQFYWKQPDLFNPNVIQHHIEVYIKPHFRIGPYVIGILLGFYLANFQRYPSPPERSRVHIIGGWTASVVLGAWAIYGVYPSLVGWGTGLWPLYHTLYGAIHRDVFAISLAWLIYACHTGIGGVINRILSLSPLIPLSSLGYAVYLFHMIPVFLTYFLTSFPMWYSTKLIIFAYCFVQLLISYLLAIICVLLAEYPALNIETVLFHSPRLPKVDSPAKEDVNDHLGECRTVPTANSEIKLKAASVSS